MPDSLFAAAKNDEKPLLPFLGLAVLVVLAGAVFFLTQPGSVPQFWDLDPNPSVSPGVLTPLRVNLASQVALQEGSVELERQIIHVGDTRIETFSFNNAESQVADFVVYYVVPKTGASDASMIQTFYEHEVVLDDPIVRVFYRVRPGGRLQEQLTLRAEGALKSCIIPVVLSTEVELSPAGLDALKRLAESGGLECSDAASCLKCNEAAAELNRKMASATDISEALVEFVVSRSETATGYVSEATGREVGGQTVFSGSDVVLFVSERVPKIKARIPLPGSDREETVLSKLQPTDLVDLHGRRFQLGDVLHGEPLVREESGTWFQPITVDLSKGASDFDALSLASISTAVEYRNLNEPLDAKPRFLPVSVVVDHVDLSNHVFVLPDEVRYTTGEPRPVYAVNNLKIPVQIDICGFSSRLEAGQTLRYDLGSGGDCVVRVNGNPLKSIRRVDDSQTPRMRVADLAVPPAEGVTSIFSCANGYCDCNSLEKSFSLFHADFSAWTLVDRDALASYPDTASPDYTVSRTYLVRNGDAGSCPVDIGGSSRLDFPAQSTSFVTFTSRIFEDSSKFQVHLNEVAQDRSLVYPITSPASRNDQVFASIFKSSSRDFGSRASEFEFPSGDPEDFG